MTVISMEPQPFQAMEVLARAQKLEAEGHRICHLELGEPASPAAPEVREAVRGVLDRPQRYTHARGTRELRLALADYYRAQHGIDVDPDRIMATTGSSAGFILTFLAAFKPGERIAVTRPGYPAYFNIIRSLGFEVAELPVTAEQGWHLDPVDLEAAHCEKPIAGLLFASPANPTGAVAGRERLTALIGKCDELGIRFISDEIYHGLEFEADPVSALEITERAIVINSFSKFHCMTGWRIGWLVAPEDLNRALETRGQSLFISPPSLSQIAGLAALDARHHGDAQRAHNLRNRDTLVKGLRRLGFADVQEPEGAFYAYVDVSGVTGDSQRFCLDLLERAGVAATPGIDFDRTDGHRYVRFSYAGAGEDIEEAISRMGQFLSS